MGWDVDVLQDAVNTCTNPSGTIEDCPVFQHMLQDAADYSKCNITLPAELDSEDVVGPMSTLPGNPPIESGPAPASGKAISEPLTDYPGSSTESSAISSSVVPYSVVSSPAVASSVESPIAPIAKAAAIPTVSYSPVSISPTPPPATPSTSPTSAIKSATYTTSTTTVIRDGQVIEEVIIIEEDIFTTTIEPRVSKRAAAASRHGFKHVGHRGGRRAGGRRLH